MVIGQGPSPYPSSYHLNLPGKREAEPDKQSPDVTQETEKEALEKEKKAQQAADNKEIQELQKRDTEVRTHEQAHLAAAGGLAISGASFSYQTGPDGKQYAVGGEVSIDTSPVPNNPQATAQKAKRIKAAAMAPAEPSGPDRAVFAAAARMEVEAQAKAMQEQKEETEDAASGATDSNQTPNADKAEKTEAPQKPSIEEPDNSSYNERMMNLRSYRQNTPETLEVENSTETGTSLFI